jgi:hypothetical protein
MQSGARASMCKRKQLCASESKNAQASTKTKIKRKNTTYKLQTLQNKTKNQN